MRAAKVMDVWKIVRNKFKGSNNVILAKILKFIG